jgi:lipopolysaccharide export LptBFGC system permease protein LptF
MKIDEAKYKNDFGIDPEDREKRKAALEKALDIRKFEIELYWKRSTYFWTLIAAAFAGYFIILGAQNLDGKKFLAFVVACVGFLFTFAWFQVNRGSKQW